MGFHVEMTFADLLTVGLDCASRATRVVSNSQGEVSPVLSIMLALCLPFEI